MNAQSLDRIRFVTRHFTELQGLGTLVPLGVIFISQGVVHLSRHRPFVYLVEIMISLGCCAAVLLLHRYYRQTFGEVEQRQAGLGVGGSSLPVYSPAGRTPVAAGTRPLNPKLRWLILATVAYALLILLKAILPAATLIANSADPWFAQAWYYGWGTVFLALWFFRWERSPSQMYYLAIGLLLLGLAVLGTFWGLILPELRNLKIGSLLQLLPPLLAYRTWAQILCGASLVLAGLLDHLQLVRVLKPVKEIS